MTSRETSGLAVFRLLASSVLLAATVAALPVSPAQAEKNAWIEKAAELGVDFVHFNGMSGELYYVETMAGGCAVFDYDRDGDLDLYLVQGGMLGGKSFSSALLPNGMARPNDSLRDRLYRNDLEIDEEGRHILSFTDVTAATKINADFYGMGAATGDYDNDGWIDLYVTAYGANQLWHNRGDGTFEDMTESSGTGDLGWSLSAAFIDIDLDGWLDLYVGRYLDAPTSKTKNCPAPTGERDYCGPLGYRPLADRLFHNNGDGTFEEVATEVGLGTTANGMGVLPGDFDGNGWPDIYVANDAMANQLWLNQGPDQNGKIRFIDDALFAGNAFNIDGKPEGSMGLTGGDVNGDGLEDFLVTHLVSESHTLYLNRGEGSFLDATSKSGLASPSWAYTGFGTGLFDYDLDGDLDLLVVNGAVQNFDRNHFGPATDEWIQEPLMPTWRLHQPNQLFENQGNGIFVEISADSGAAFLRAEVSRGLALGDLDQDGDLDALVLNNHGPARILINQATAGRPWIGIRALDLQRDALGAEVGLKVRDGWKWKRVRVAGSYASSRDPRIVFALEEAIPQTLRIRWPGGREETFLDVAPNHYSDLRRGEGRSEPIPESGNQQGNSQALELH